MAASMLSVQGALEIVLRVAQRLPPQTVSLHHALGKILAQDVAAPDPLPPYPASIKVSLSLSCNARACVFTYVIICGRLYLCLLVFLGLFGAVKLWLSLCVCVCVWGEIVEISGI